MTTRIAGAAKEARLVTIEDRLYHALPIVVELGSVRRNTKGGTGKDPEVGHSSPVYRCD
jgi:hypothetical protein